MNKRIDELFGKALDAAVPETWTTLTPAQLTKLKNKFAELIVKESYQVVIGKPNISTSLAGRNMLNHFGVEE